MGDGAGPAGVPAVLEGCPRGGCSARCHPRARASIRAPGSPRPLLLTLGKMGPACGPGVYLRCSISRAKYYASVLLCDHLPTTPHRERARARVACEGEGIVASSADCVYTLAHAVGFVTRSLHVARCFTEAPARR